MTLEDYMKLPYRLEIIPDMEENGFVAYYPELPGCITCGETIADAVANIEDAKREWMSAAIEENIEIAIPEKITAYYSQLNFKMPKGIAQHIG